MSADVSYVAGIESYPALPDSFVLATTVSNPEFPSALMFGALAEVGSLGLASGLSGLAVPEPDAAALAVAAGAALGGVATRRR